MASVVTSANLSPLISRNRIGEAVRDSLHLHVGRGRRYTVKALSEATGVPERCIEAAKCGPDDTEYRPLKLEELASLIKFLGAPFASSILEIAGLGTFELMDGQPPLPRTLDPCKQPAKLSREDHIRKAREHLIAAETAE